MRIEPYGRGTFLVHAHGDTFTVDLGCHEGSGACDCVHYLARIKPVIEEDKKLGTFKPHDRYRCPHILAARTHLLDLFLVALNRMYPDSKDHEI